MIGAVKAHLPILLIAVPLLAAPLCALFRHPLFAWGLSMLVTAASFAGALGLLAMVMAGGPLSYHLGGWAPPWGIEFRLDAANAIILVIVAGVGAVTMAYARASVGQEISRAAQPLFYTAMLLCFAGLMGVAATGDAFNLFVFLEISSLSSYVIIAMGAERDKRALTSAYTYLVMGTIGATFYVIGIGLIYSVTGTLNMADMAARIAELEQTRTIPVAFAFILIGLALKLAMYPLHLWLPNAYTYAPTVVTAFLAATSTKVAGYASLRFIYTVFAADFAFEERTLLFLFLPLGLVAMFASSAVAIFQSDVKRLLAYSSIAQVGYMVLGVSYGNVTGLSATILHLFNHALMKGGLFLAVGCVVFRLGSHSIDSFRGLGRQMPWTMAAFVIGGLGLIGVPATVGFVSKWYLVLGAFERGWWPVALLIVASSLLAIIYVWRVVETAYLQPAPAGRTVKEAPLSLLLPCWALILACVVFGVYADPTVTIAKTAAQSLFFDPGAGLPVRDGP